MTTAMVVGDPAEGVIKWDVTITYEFDNGTVVDHSLAGTYSDRINCSGNWTTVSTSSTFVSDDSHFVKYRIDYDEGMLLEKEQADQTVEWNEYACDDSWTTEPIGLESGWALVGRDSVENPDQEQGECNGGETDTNRWVRYVWTGTESYRDAGIDIREDFTDICQDTYVLQTLSTGVPFTGSIAAYSSDVGPCEELSTHCEHNNTGDNATEVQGDHRYLYGVEWDPVRVATFQYDFDPFPLADHNAVECEGDEVHTDGPLDNYRHCDWHDHSETSGFYGSSGIVEEGIGDTQSRYDWEPDS